MLHDDNIKMKNLIHVRILFNSLHDISFWQWTSIWNIAIEIDDHLATLYQKYDAYWIPTNSFECYFSSSKVSVCMCDSIVKVIVTVEIERNMWKKTVELCWTILKQKTPMK